MDKNDKKVKKMGDKTEDIPSIRQRTHKGVDDIMDKAQNMRESGKEKMAHLKEKAMKVKENVDGYIQKNPERSVLVAAGVGLAAGAILTATIIKRNK